ncbi:MAG: hypothetical protein GDA44_04350 [Prochloron sp. SP5CPC1]|nr:hypothetical protein [Candidatus Paraprochloron terpiosi SP5CPC1]
MINQPTQKNYSQIITLIFENAQQSIKDLDSSINVFNTKLSAVTGFSVVLMKFVGDLPDQSLEITSSDTIRSLSCYSCSLFKIISWILLITSTLISFIALLPKKVGNDRLISPAEQVEKCLDLSEDEYKLLFINQYDRDIESLIEKRDWKARRLNWSGITFVGAAVLSALDLLLDIFITYSYFM